MGSISGPCPERPPTLHLVRHCQAEHNVVPEHVARPDTILTEAGRLQAATLRSAFPEPLRHCLGAVVSSPLRRALQTALIGFEDLVADTGVPAAPNGIPELPRSVRLKVIALPEAQETSDLPCDTGLPVSELVAEFDSPDSRWQGSVDFSILTGKEWGSKSGRWACDRETIEKRARDARRWLRNLMRQLEGEESKHDCVLVTHGGFLHFLTENWEDFDQKQG